MVSDFPNPHSHLYDGIYSIYNRCHPLSDPDRSMATTIVSNIIQYYARSSAIIYYYPLLSIINPLSSTALNWGYDHVSHHRLWPGRQPGDSIEFLGEGMFIPATIASGNLFNGELEHGHRKLVDLALKHGDVPELFCRVIL